ncbi:hypothetical protein BXA15_06645 [Campylobacter lari]|uniref:hypothetical protein n=1 Tax=Campylobacter TaxID=194 RepID=UPI000B3F8EA4|nr:MULTISPECIES: hypothetical protein [Campylobacter]MCR8685976.1 hypothetical protein [Campylobacter sp. 1569]EAH6262655.1 hypothetical protein [Campylobacter lari]EAI3897239.1 hypothetical protein [Campylobacter lari]EAI4303602.1 hypothetical protein [Campylobacter lari]EAI5466731.1 hypothetical protein [Campylobacter lari]
MKELNLKIKIKDEHYKVLETLSSQDNKSVDEYIFSTLNKFISLDISLALRVENALILNKD